MSLSNSLMYEGRLECGSERTATSLIDLPSLPRVLSELGSQPQQDLAWLQAALLPSNPVCFLDCSEVRIMDAAEGADLYAIRVGPGLGKTKVS